MRPGAREIWNPSNTESLGAKDSMTQRCTSPIVFCTPVGLGGKTKGADFGFAPPSVSVFVLDFFVFSSGAVCGVGEKTEARSDETVGVAVACIDSADLPVCGLGISRTYFLPNPISPPPPQHNTSPRVLFGI